MTMVSFYDGMFLPLGRLHKHNLERGFYGAYMLRSLITTVNGWLTWCGHFHFSPPLFHPLYFTPASRLTPSAFHSSQTTRIHIPPIHALQPATLFLFPSRISTSDAVVNILRLPPSTTIIGKSSLSSCCAHFLLPLEAATRTNRDNIFSQRRTPFFLFFVHLNKGQNRQRSASSFTLKLGGTGFQRKLRDYV